MPRMDEAEKLAYGATLAITEEGMTIFNTQFNRYEYWDGGAWVTIATGASLTGTSLDDVYDAGGLGAGRTITADQGAVQILDADGLHVQGNVGIGTVAPGTILHVEKSAIDNSIQDVLRLQTHISSSGLGGGIQFRNRWSNGDYWTMGRITAIEQNGFGGQLIFSTNLGSGTADDVTAEAMRIDENGRLGIGTTTPAEELHVIGDIRSSALIGGGNVQADASGNLIVSNDLPGADDSYIHNQNALDQAANYRINGWGEAFGLKINSGDGEKVQFTSLGASGSKIRHTTGWAIDYHAGPGNTTTTGSHRFYTTAQNIYRETWD